MSVHTVDFHESAQEKLLKKSVNNKILNRFLLLHTHKLIMDLVIMTPARVAEPNDCEVAVAHTFGRVAFPRSRAGWSWVAGAGGVWTAGGLAHLCPHYQ